LGRAVVLFHSTNLAVRTRTRLHADFVACTAFGPQSVGAVNGLEVGPDRILMTRPDTEVEFVVAAGYQSVAFLVPPEDLRTHLRDRQREEDYPFCTDGLPGIELLKPSPADARRLYRWGRKLTKIAAQQPEILNLPQTRAFVQAELFENLLATLGSVVRAELAPHDVTRQNHSRIVKLVQDYVLRHAAERLHITDLCEAAGVSERTLQYAFREVMGMTPVAYLTRLRLHRVREGLLAANHGTTTVTNEALRWGFWHFGDFSCAYKRCFGELPSETLRRNC
jgi:AraC-like DNA-binding protein